MPDFWTLYKICLAVSLVAKKVRRLREPRPPAPEGSKPTMEVRLEACNRWPSQYFLVRTPR